MQDKNSNKINFIEGMTVEEIFVKTARREEVDWSEHTHNKHQLIYTISGTLHVTIGQERHFVTSKHLVWIPSGVSHHLSSNNAQVSLLVCCFSMRKKNADLFSIFVANEFATYNLSVLAEYGFIDKRKNPELFGFAINFLSLIPKVCQKSKFTLQPFIVKESDRLFPVLAYIGKNYSESLSIEAVANRFALSVRNLTRMFTRANIKFVSYLNHVRIVRSLELLADNEMSIEQISYEVGFSSPSCFNRVFKKITGNSPSYYFQKK